MPSLLQVDDIHSDAMFILLVEKDAAFMRLAEDRFYNTYPCIILTAKGQPDVASRYIVFALGDANCFAACLTNIIAACSACMRVASGIQALPPEA
jgi:DNA topoisomerase VI subunit A